MKTIRGINSRVVFYDDEFAGDTQKGNEPHIKNAGISPFARAWRHGNLRLWRFLPAAAQDE